MRYFKIIISVLLIIITFIAVSWHLKILFSYFLYLLNNNFIKKSNIRIVNKITFTLFLALSIFAYPARKVEERSYIQSIYFNKHTQGIVSVPIIPYISNIIGEGDMLKGVSLSSKIVPDAYLKRKSALTDILTYLKRTPVRNNNFSVQYRILEREGTPSNNLTFQFMKGLGYYKDIEHYFLHIPKNCNLNECEIIVFCHGYGGNWLFYTQLFAEYTDAIIIAAETPDLNGIFSHKVMDNIVKCIIPHAYSQIGIKYRKPHIVGLSNGGTAVNIAVKLYPNSFDQAFIISSTLREVSNTGKKVNIIYGSGDKSGGVRGGIPLYVFERYVFKSEDHSILARSPQKVFNIINNIIDK